MTSTVEPSFTARSGVPSYAPGHVVGGRYRLVRSLGAGSMGEVYEVEHTQLPRRFALKMLQSRYISDERARRRFRSEAEVGALLQSPHLVSVFDYDIEKDAPFFVMELLNGEDVRSLLRRVGRLTVETAVRVVRDAAAGLRTAHRLGIVHRDLKPANLFLCRDVRGDFCRVLDFGVAKIGTGPECPLPASSSCSDRLIGTLAYMAPEQIRASTPVDGRADVYSLGAILYEMLSGSRPFEASNDHELMYKVLHEEPRPLEEGESAAADMVQRAMNKDPGARPSMDVFFAELDRLVSNRADLDATAGSENRARPDISPPRSSRRARLVLSMAVACGALGALAYGRHAAMAGASARVVPGVSRIAHAESSERERPSPAAIVVAPAPVESREMLQHASIARPAPRSKPATSSADQAPPLGVERRNPYKP